VGDVTLAEGELRIPFEYMDSAHTRIYRSSVPGAVPGSVPVLLAYLDICNVISCDGALPMDADAGRLDALYDQAGSRWTLQIAGQPDLSVSVSALSVSVTVTDRKLGQHELRMRM
jgi:hypothetical protein